MKHSSRFVAMAILVGLLALAAFAAPAQALAAANQPAAAAAATAPQAADDDLHLRLPDPFREFDQLRRSMHRQFAAMDRTFARQREALNRHFAALQMPDVFAEHGLAGWPAFHTPHYLTDVLAGTGAGTPGVPASAPASGPVATAGDGSGDVSLFGRTAPLSLSSTRLDLVEKGDHYEVHAELAGIPKENIRLQLNDGVLTLTGEHERRVDEAKPAAGQPAAQTDAPRYHYRERSFASVKRSIRVPADVDAQAVTAKYENGLLTVNLPKLPEDKQPKTHIPIA